MRDTQWRSIYNKGYYGIGGWVVFNGNCVQSPWFCMDELPSILRGMETFTAMPLDGDLNIHCRMTNLGTQIAEKQFFLNAYTIFEARRRLLEQALSLEDELKIIVGETLALGVPLGAFDLLRLEGCACVLHQAMWMASTTGKARM